MTSKPVALLLADLGVTQSHSRPHVSNDNPYSEAQFKTLKYVQRFFDLAVDGGYVGQITANSFMKREFGRKLIEQYLPTQDLSLIVDTSGAYIPGHGTPTVLLFGRHWQPVNTTVRAVLGIRGEPSAPADPAKGLVWRSIVKHVDEPGAQSEYVTVTDWRRATVSAYPWSLSGGGAGALRERIERVRQRLSNVMHTAGITSFTLEDDVYVRPPRALDRDFVERDVRRVMVLGDQLRDWGFSAEVEALFPYNADFRPIHVEQRPMLLHAMWPWETNLANSLMFGRTSKIQAGLRWTEFGQLTHNKLLTPLSVTFAFVATHNHFVLDRGGKVFKQTAPVIKLPEGASEDDHLRLLGLLNSSTACFWLKQVSHDKGNGGIGGGIASEDWERFFEFTGTKLAQFPLPDGSPLELTRDLDALAQDLGPVSPAGVCGSGVPTRQRLSEARDRWDAIRADMISAQEELDWEVYGLYGLLDNHTDDLIDHDVP